jgi:hypothetical protein
MTTPNQILVALLAEQSTSDALAESMRAPMLAVRAMCERHEKDELVTHATVAGCLTVWQLTESGREKAEALKSSAP